MLYSVSNNYVKFGLINGIVKIDNLRNFLGEYINFSEITKLADNDFLIHLMYEEKLIKRFNCIPVDDHFVFYTNNTLYVGIKNDTLSEIVFLKRIISDLVNRFFELKKGLFLHSSSIVDANKSIVFIGEKGSGKTTNMLNILEKYPIGYSSNERTGIIYNGNKLFTYGTPSRINIRTNTLVTNSRLRNKLSSCIDKNKYLEYSKLNLPRDCAERLVVEFNDISSCLDVDVIPSASLGAICNLIYDPDIKFKMEKVDYLKIKKAIKSSIIDGVFPSRKILNSIFSTDIINCDELFETENINYYNIYQNNKVDNSKKIIKVLRRDYENENN